eukprot:366149-Chlamydomonas_euryale.AAC.1
MSCTASFPGAGNDPNGQRPSGCMWPVAPVGKGPLVYAQPPITYAQLPTLEAPTDACPALTY